MLRESRSIHQGISAITRYLGWRHWSVIEYNSILENFFLVLFIHLKSHRVEPGDVGLIFSFLLFSILSTSYGYLINDFADVDLDRRHGKENTFQNDSPLKAGMIVVLTLCMSIPLGYPFFGKSLFAPLWIVWVLTATFYSLKPLRLKERGRSGLMVVVLAQRVIPALLVFTAFEYSQCLDVVVLTFYIFLRGISSDLNHQLEDYRSDQSTDTKTYAVRAGMEKGRRVQRYVWEAEKLLLLLSLGLMSVRLFDLTLFRIPSTVPLLAVYAAIYGSEWRHRLQRGWEVCANPFERGSKNLSQFVHHGFPSVVMPLYLCLWLCLEHWYFLSLLVTIILLRRLFSVRSILESYPIAFVKRIARDRSMV